MALVLTPAACRRWVRRCAWCCQLQRETTGVGEGAALVADVDSRQLLVFSADGRCLAFECSLPPAVMASGHWHSLRVSSGRRWWRWVAAGVYRAAVLGIAALGRRLLMAAGGYLPAGVRGRRLLTLPGGWRWLPALGGRLLRTLAGEWRLASVSVAGRCWRRCGGDVCQSRLQQAAARVCATVALAVGDGGGRPLSMAAGWGLACMLMASGRCLSWEWRDVTWVWRSPPALVDCNRFSSVLWRHVACGWCPLAAL